VVPSFAIMGSPRRLTTAATVIMAIANTLMFFFGVDIYFNVRIIGALLSFLPPLPFGSSGGVFSGQPVDGAVTGPLLDGGSGGWETRVGVFSQVRVAIVWVALVGAADAGFHRSRLGWGQLIQQPERSYRDRLRLVEMRRMHRRNHEQIIFYAAAAWRWLGAGRGPVCSWVRTGGSRRRRKRPRAGVL